MTQTPTTQKRILSLTDTVNSSTVSPIIKSIIEYNIDDDNKEKEVGTAIKRTPILLIINSFGGSVYDGLGLISVMLNSKTPIHTLVTGKAQSMAFAIFLAGHYRIASLYSTFMYHDVITGAQGSIETMKQSLEEGVRVRQLVDDIILRRTKMTAELLSEVQKVKLDWVITPKEAVKFGVAHTIEGTY